MSARKARADTSSTETPETEKAQEVASRACGYGLAVDERVRLWDVGYTSFQTLRTMAYTLNKCGLVLEVEAHPSDSSLVSTFGVRRARKAATA